MEAVIPVLEREAMRPAVSTVREPAETFEVGHVAVEFEFNAPIAETGRISESFDHVSKGAYATAGAAEFIAEAGAGDGRLDGQFVSRFVIAKIFRTLAERAAREPLDYLQKLRVNGTEFWCVDNGDYVTLMLPEEY